MVWWFSILSLCAACSFQVPSVYSAVGDAGNSDGPLGTIDGNPPDLTSTLGGFTPSHVVAADVVGGAASLTSVHDIDTANLLIDNVAPTDVVFKAEASNDNWAVLSVRDFTVMNDVTIHGRRALIVIADGAIDIGGVLHGEAQQRTPGPGGNYTGPGVGSDGKEDITADSGGGGGGHATLGAAGGDSTAHTNEQGGPGGAAYMDELAAGSGGGQGSGATGTDGQPACPSSGNWSLGGAGGGTIQLSAKVSLTIEQAGGINVGGGGGRAGCGLAASAAGGGGSGGSIWIEAPSMTLYGTLAANGGGGGSGGYTIGVSSSDGSDGTDGTLDANPARGGGTSAKGSGAGGSGGAGSTLPTPGGAELNGGGGGGAAGQINIRTRNVSPITDSSTVVSPAPVKSTTF